MNIHFNMTKKEKILKTALKLIAKQGIQETPMSQISKESGVAMGTIYHHFNSKTEIINAIYIYLKQEMGNALLNIPEQSNDYKKNFFRIWNNLYEFYCQNEEVFKFLQTYKQSPLISDETKEQGQKYYQPIIDFLQQGIQDKVFKPNHLVLLTETLHGNVVALVHIYFQKTITVNKSIVEQAIKMSWDSVINHK